MDPLLEELYSHAFKDRWPTLKAALSIPHPHFKRPNAFFLQAPHLAPDYPMDAASLLPALWLQVQANETVGDLCAAPGGKALILAEALWGEKASHEGKLFLNDLSPDRRRRLKQVLSSYLPPSIIDPGIVVTGRDAGKWCLRETEFFDAVLLDVPCSSERHLLEQTLEGKSRALKQWTVGRPKQLARRQYALLCSAFQLLKPGGRLVYSTCALLDTENDEVLLKFKKKYGKSVIWDAPSEQQLEYYGDLMGAPITFEKKKLGIQILPDRSAGFGPIYTAGFQKIPE